jgi:hypothetical protein
MFNILLFLPYLCSSHDEIIEIRLKIGELLVEHEKLHAKRHRLNQGTDGAGAWGAGGRSRSSPGARAGTAPGGPRPGQRARSPLRSRPTSPPVLEKFMQFERLHSSFG